MRLRPREVALDALAVLDAAGAERAVAGRHSPEGSTWAPMLGAEQPERVVARAYLGP